MFVCFLLWTQCITRDFTGRNSEIPFRKDRIETDSESVLELQYSVYLITVLYNIKKEKDR